MSELQIKNRSEERRSLSLLFSTICVTTEESSFSCHFGGWYMYTNCMYTLSPKSCEGSLLFCITLEGCYSVSNGHAAFKPVIKLVLFSKTLVGCQSVSNGHAAFKLVQFASFSKLYTVAHVPDQKETPELSKSCSRHFGKMFIKKLF